MLECIKENVINENMKSDTIQNKISEIRNNLKMNNSLKHNALEHMKESMGDNNKRNNALENKINATDNSTSVY